MTERHSVKSLGGNHSELGGKARLKEHFLHSFTYVFASSLNTTKGSLIQYQAL